MEVMEKGATTAMAIAGRSLRLCDACGRERARWYCKADEAYLCERCDASVHGANAVSLRHERLQIGPGGTLLMKRSAADSLEASAQMKERARSSSTRGGGAKEFGTTEAKAEEMADPTDSFLVHTPDEEEAPRQVPVFDPVFHEEGVSDTCHEDDLRAFAVPSCTDPEAEADRDAGEEVEEEAKCFRGGHKSASEFCDMNSFMTMEDMLMDSKSPGHSFGELSFEGDETVNVKLEEGDELDQIKLEVDEMLGIAFGAAGAGLKEEDEEAHDSRRANKITLKLDYEDVLNAWSDRGPFWTEGPRPQTVPDDSSFDPQRMLDHDMGSEFCTDTGSQAEVPVVNFCEERGDPSAGREARVMRYKEKRRTRLFSKTIRYEVRKLNAERRPRLKGRFVKRI